MVQILSGVGLGSANVLSVTLRQIVVPRGSLALSTGGYRLLIFGTIPIGATLGARTGVAVGSIGLALSALPMTTRPIRGLRSPQDAKPELADAAESR